MIDGVTIGRVAGLIEGEGYLALSKRSEGSGRSAYPGSPLIRVGMTDEDVIRWLAAVWGVKANGPYNPGAGGRKPVWNASLFGSVAAGWMMTLYPLLGFRRQERIRAVLAMWKCTASRPQTVWAGTYRG